MMSLKNVVVQNMAVVLLPWRHQLKIKARKDLMNIIQHSCYNFHITDSFWLVCFAFS